MRAPRFASATKAREVIPRYYITVYPLRPTPIPARPAASLRIPVRAPGLVAVAVRLSFARGRLTPADWLWGASVNEAFARALRWRRRSIVGASRLAQVTTRIARVWSDR